MLLRSADMPGSNYARNVTLATAGIQRNLCARFAGEKDFPSPPGDPKIFITLPMREQILELLRTNTDKPFSKTQIAKQLNIPGDRKGELGGILSDLVDGKHISIGSKNLYSVQTEETKPEVKKAGGKKAAATSPAPKNSLTGSIKFLPNGHAFFYPVIGDEANEAAGIDFTVHSRIFIPRDKTETALDGDTVRISTSAPTSKPRQRGPAPDDQEMRGKVLEVLSRRSGRIVGVFREKKNFKYVETDDKALEGRINIVGDTTAEPGQTVVVDLESWDNPSSDPTGRVIEVLGWPGDAGVDILSTIARYGLRTSFPGRRPPGSPCRPGRTFRGRNRPPQGSPEKTHHHHRPRHREGSRRRHLHSENQVRRMASRSPHRRCFPLRETRIAHGQGGGRARELHLPR